MRNSRSRSSSKTRNTSVQDESASNNKAAEKASAKKLKQARLPFKVIAPVISPVVPKPTTAQTVAEKNEGSQELRNDLVKDQQKTETKKRRLSDDEANECAIFIDADANVSKENFEKAAAASKKKKISDITPEVISLLEDEDDNGSSNEDNANFSGPKTPKPAVSGKRKGAGTPQSLSGQKDKTGCTPKLQIKLPLSAGKKNKRRKSSLHRLTHNTTQEISSDDIEEIEFNPQKRKKPNDNCDEKESETNGEIQQDVEKSILGSESEVEKEKLEDEKETEELKDDSANLKETPKSLSEKEIIKIESLKQLSVQNDRKDKTHTAKTENNESIKHEETKESTISSNTCSIIKNSLEETQEVVKVLESSNEIEEFNEKIDLDVSAQSDNDNEADDERDNMSNKAINISFDISDDAKSKPSTIEPTKNVHNTNSTVKPQTPKQIKLMEQRRKAREEKERKLQEEKMKKQQEKEEKELAKKREREEKEEQKRKEREEKEEQKRKEREEKERKRLAELEAKNEEKRKKNEAKEEELRKKEEERKKKEQEKEEAELKKRKAAQAFTKFFVAKTPISNQPKNDEDSNTGDDTKLLAFRPFQVKGDMKLAPICRKIFTTEEKSLLDNLLGCRHKIGVEGNQNDQDDDIVRRKSLPKSQLYLSELRSGKLVPGKWRRSSTESKDDVIIVEDELDRVGQAIVEETPAYIREQMRVKFYKFHDNRRPPYYGTWRKKSLVVKPRRPFAQDKKIFDYEMDSDDEWEEEEPGESLEDGSDDDKEKESEDDDYEVDNEWFVPHGHLSDEELQNEDEYGMGDDNTREAQKVKLQILQQEFAQEMKKKTEKIKPRLIGCIWADINGNQPSNCANILWDALEKKAMIFTDSPLVEELETERTVDPSSPSSAINGNLEKSAADKLKPITLTDSMIKDLTRLIHGNNHSKNFLINEYIAYVEKTEQSVKNGDLRKPFKSVIRDKIDEMAEWQVVNATASTLQDMELNNDDSAETNKKKKKGKRRLCWVVKQEMLDKMNLSSLELQNSWQYTLQPKFIKAEKDVKTEENLAGTTDECLLTPATETIEDTEKGKEKQATPQIKKTPKVSTSERKTKKEQNSSGFSSNQSEKCAAETKSNSVYTTHQHTKDKKRVPLLMSVARGQQISTPTKNKLISQFLQQKGKDKEKAQKISPSTSNRSKTRTSPTVQDDDIVILD